MVNLYVFLQFLIHFYTYQFKVVTQEINLVLFTNWRGSLCTGEKPLYSNVLFKGTTFRSVPDFTTFRLLTLQVVKKSQV